MWNNKCTATNLPSLKRSKKDKQDSQDAAGEARTKLLVTLSYGALSKDESVRANQQNLPTTTLSGFSLEDLPGAMDDKDGWRGIESGKSLRAAQLNVDVHYLEENLKPKIKNFLHKKNGNNAGIEIPIINYSRLNPFWKNGSQLSENREKNK